jgi:hypothetical protein
MSSKPQSVKPQPNSQSSATKDEKLSASPATSDTSTGSSYTEAQASLRISDVPTFELNKVEFLEKLGEGTILQWLTYIGAFGKVRLAKLNLGGGISDPKQSNSPSKVKSQRTAAAKEDPILSPRGGQELDLCAIKILSKYAILKAKQVDHVYNELALQQQLRHPFIV